MSNQESAKKKGLTKKRRKGLGLKRKRHHHRDSNTLRSHELNLAHLRGVPSFLYPAPKPWQPPNKPKQAEEVS